jgi:hypothetical protein
MPKTDPNILRTILLLSLCFALTGTTSSLTVSASPHFSSGKKLEFPQAWFQLNEMTGAGLLMLYYRQFENLLMERQKL